MQADRTHRVNETLASRRAATQDLRRNSERLLLKLYDKDTNEYLFTRVPWRGCGEMRSLVGAKRAPPDMLSPLSVPLNGYYFVARQEKKK